MNDRDYYLRKARRTGRETDWSTYRRLRNQCTRLIRHSKTRNIFAENSNNPKIFWKQVKKIYPAKPTMSNLSKSFEIGGKVTSDSKVIANAFYNYFTNIGIKRLKSTLMNLANTTWPYIDWNELSNSINPNEYRFEFKDVSEITVLCILKKLKKNVSSGYDEIPALLIVDGAEEIARPLSFLLNNMFANSIFP